MYISINEEELKRMVKSATLCELNSLARIVMEEQQKRSLMMVNHKELTVAKKNRIKAIQMYRERNETTLMIAKEAIDLVLGQ